ncbi:hypothetical protein IFM89_009686 [Coptis chinensis]|uniref:lipoyl(octanoyl) transferase n=1 Tax=Coptis chinensis TaxID=261450 RepID=A0A835IMH3_9MAGN|nr:hypothetical protein IFM89_009686 [Coptis chinensis]
MQGSGREGYRSLDRHSKERKLEEYMLYEMRIPRNLNVWKMGMVNYLDALKLQEKLVSDRKLGKIPDTILSLQHPPTYTLGKRRTDHNLLVPEADLRTMGAELHYTQRGGDITYHGPHQAILYPIISLKDKGLGARKYVENLESIMIELASLYGVSALAGMNKCETGVWVGDRKIGAIGVRISSGITSHGMAFNIDPDLNYFKHIVPCGIADKEVTSLKRETNMVLPAEEVIQEQLVSCFARSFGYDTLVQKENKLGHIDADGVVQLKGRAACLIDTGDVLLVTELMFNGTFNDLDPRQVAALASCFIPGDRSNEQIHLRTELAKPLQELQDSARRIAEVCGFVELLMTLDLLRSADHAVGELDLESKFAVSSESLWRGIMFANSVYTHDFALSVFQL